MTNFGEVIKQKRKWDAPCFMCSKTIRKGDELLRIRWLSSNGLGLFGYFHTACGNRMIHALSINTTNGFKKGTHENSVL